MSITIDNFTVVIPTYNRLEMLQRLLDTIPRTINVIISDNGASIPDQVIAKYSEFKFFKTEKILSAPDNWNKCVKLCQTEWFTIPSDDDLYFANAFEIISRQLKIEKDTDLIIFGHKIIDGNDNVTGCWAPTDYTKYPAPYSYSKFKYGVEARFPGMIFKKNIVVDNGSFPTSYTLTAGDSKLVQMCMLTGKVSFVPETFAGYRVWESGTTSQTLSTTKWLTEIDRWQDEILMEAVPRFEQVGIKLSARHIKDEIFAKNLIGGLQNLRQNKGILSSIKFLLGHRYPFKAYFKTKLHIIKTVLIG